MKAEESGFTFTSKDLEGVETPHDNLLVVTTLVGNHNIHRILVDISATLNLMYYNTLKAMGLTQNHLVSSNTTLIDFSKESARALRVIKLFVTLGTTPQHVTTMAEILDLDSFCTYNAILGRETLNKIRCVISTYHLKLKFSTTHGVRDIKVNQVEAKSCVCGNPQF